MNIDFGNNTEKTVKARIPSPEKTRENNASDTVEMMVDPGEPPSKESPAGGFYACSNTGNIKFNYKSIPNLPENVREALVKYDEDGSGDVSLAEMLHMSDSRDELKKQVCILIGAVFTLLLVLFLVSFAAATLAQTTAANSDSLTAPNSDKILKTAAPEQSVPVALSSLLDKANLARVSEVTISNMAFAPASDAVTTSDPIMCTACPTDTIMQVAMAKKYDDTFVEYVGVGATPTVISIKKGKITVTNFPGFGTQVFEACGSATCSTISVSGVDVASLKAKATELGFVSTAGNRRHPTDGSIRRAAKGASCFDDNAAACANVKDWDFSVATVTQNNLGGAGPDTADTQEIRYSGVADGIDLILTTASDYEVNPKVKDYNGRQLDGAGNNGMDGKFGIVNVKGGTSVDMTFTLVETGTTTPVEIDPAQTVFFSVLDLDADKATNKGKAYEFVDFTTPVDSYAVTDSTSVILTGNNNNLYARSGRYGNNDDNPSDPLAMTQLQRDSTISITYKGRNTWGMTFGEDNNPQGKKGRNLMFAGRAQGDCPPGPIPPPPGACDTHTKGIEGVIKGGGRVCCPDACGGPRSPDAPYACGGPQCEKGPDRKRDDFRYANCCVGKPISGGNDKAAITAPYGIVEQRRFCSWGPGKGGLGTDSPPCINKLSRQSDRL